jgi:hypothetical protein
MLKDCLPLFGRDMLEMIVDHPHVPQDLKDVCQLAAQGLRQDEGRGRIELR